MSLLAACGSEAPDPAAEAVTPSTTAANEAADTIPPPVPDGEPMPAATDAAGIPPYPGAIVHMITAAPASTYRVNAFTRDPKEQVVAFYQESLPGWRMIRSPDDIVVFQKEPDQAAVTISDWDGSVLGPEAEEELRRARTAIGTAWR
ncbi:MAG TPA: hypothetical protein VFP76_06255 [Gemmatimonadota bacterium]|nr:hypothetical protein [Gemmatimonadota bacterium]